MTESKNRRDRARQEQSLRTLDGEPFSCDVKHRTDSVVSVRILAYMHRTECAQCTQHQIWPGKLLHQNVIQCYSCPFMEVLCVLFFRFFFFGKR